MGKRKRPATILRTFETHDRLKATVLYQDAKLLLCVFFAPLIILIGIKALLFFGNSENEILHFGEKYDSVCLVLLVVLICTDTVAKFLFISILGWVDAWQQKSLED